MTESSMRVVAGFVGVACVAMMLWLRRMSTDADSTTHPTTDPTTAPTTDPTADSAEPDMAPTITDEIQAAAASVRNAFMPSDAADLVPSPELLDMLKASEGLSLTPYLLGDGGATIGYGRYYPASGPAAPARITQAQADQWLADDVEARGARWVRTYVTAPLLQNQFDALVSMAYNLSPRSFKTIAQAINDGQDPEAAALQFVRSGSNLERGLRNRRGREIALYRAGVYA